MTRWHERSNRTLSGGLRKTNRRSNKRLAWKGSDPTETIVAKEDKRKAVRGLGSTRKVKQRKASKASVAIPGEKKIVQAEILSVKENTANRLYTRRNIVTKGAIIRVTIGGKEQEAKVTSRPGQHGIVQAVLEKQEKKG